MGGGRTGSEGTCMVSVGVGRFPVDFVGTGQEGPLVY